MTTASDANALFSELLEDEEIIFPSIDLESDEFTLPYDSENPLYKSVPTVTNDDLTQKHVDGDGTFDVLMSGISAHIEKEFNRGRITGEQYSKVYLGALEAALANSTQFLLQKNSAFWQAQTAQFQAMTARIEAETAKASLVAMQYSALSEKAKYAISKMEALNMEMALKTAQFNFDNILPTQKEIADLEVDIKTFEKEGADLDNQTKDYNLSYILPEQVFLVQEQKEAQRAQTADTRSDGSTITGSIGKQKELYSQQIISYQRDAENKAAKIFSDAWITQKTIDEGLVPPQTFTNAYIDTVLTNIAVNNGLS